MGTDKKDVNFGDDKCYRSLDQLGFDAQRLLLKERKRVKIGHDFVGG